MKLVQATIPEAEFALLKRKARQEGKTIRAYVREALRAKLLPDAVDPNDPIFDVFPLVKSRGRPDRSAREHDRLLYGAP